MQIYIVSFAILLCLGITMRLLHPATAQFDPASSFIIIALFLLGGGLLSLFYRVRILAMLFFIAVLCFFFLALPLNNNLNVYFMAIFAFLIALSAALGFLKLKPLIPFIVSAFFLGYGLTCIHLDTSSPTHLKNWANDDYGEYSLVYGTVVKEPEIRPEKNDTRLTIEPEVVIHLREEDAEARISQIVDVLGDLKRDWGNEGEALYTLLLARDKCEALPEEERDDAIKKIFSRGRYHPDEEEMENIRFALSEIEKFPKDQAGRITQGWIFTTVHNTEELAQVYLDLSYYTGFGDVVKIKASLRSPHPATNPGGFDYARMLSNTNYFSMQSLYGRGSRTRPADTIQIIEERTGNFFVAWCLSIKYKLLDVIRQTTPFPDSAFLGGIFLGLRRGVPEKIMYDSRAAGTAHVFAVSGLHVTIIAIVLMLMFQQTPLPKTVWAPIIVVFLAIFTVITGARPSTLRAAIMNSFALTFYTYGKNIERSVVMAICAAGIVILTVIPSGYGGPLILPMASFLMSFSAVLFLVLMSRPVEDYFNTRLTNLFRMTLFAFVFILVGLYFINLENPLMILKAKLFWGFIIALPLTYFFQHYLPTIRFTSIPGKTIRTFIAAQVAIQCSIIPLSAVIFHRISLAAPFANFVAIPMVGIILPLGMMGTLLGFIPFIGIYLALVMTAANWLGMRFFIIWDDLWTRLMPYPQVPVWGPAVLIIFYGAVFFFIFREKLILHLRISYLRIKNNWGEKPVRTRCAGSFAALLIAVAALTMGSKSLEKPQLRVTMLDLSWPAPGMATIIQTPNGKNILIDGGFEGKWGWRKRYVNQGKRGLMEVLLGKNIISIDAAVNTNFDSSLLGALNYILASPDYEIKKLYTYLPPSEFGPQNIKIEQFARALTPAGKRQTTGLYRKLLLNDWTDTPSVQKFMRYFKTIKPEELKEFLAVLLPQIQANGSAAIGGLAEKEKQEREALVESIKTTYNKLGKFISPEQAQKIADTWKTPLLRTAEYRDFITDLPQTLQWFVFQKAGLVDSVEDLEVYRLELYDKFVEVTGETGKFYRGEERFLQYHRMLFAVKMKNIPISPSYAGMHIIKPVKIRGKELTATIINPPADRYRGKYVTDSNSTVLRISYGNTSVLLTSLINQKASESMLELRGGIRSTVYEVPEFGKGGRFIDTARVLDAVNPRYAIFHYKRGNYVDKRYQEVWDLCQDRGIDCLNTAIVGAVTITTDGETVQVTSMLKGKEGEISDEVAAPSKEEELGSGM